MLLKYIVFYIFMMHKSSNYALFKIGNLNSFEDFFYYLWIFLFLPIVCFILFSGPIYYSFTKRNLSIFILINIIVLIAEYTIYTYFASQSDWFNGIINVVISVLCFTLLFQKEIKELIIKK
jgi:hypothetical protein